MENRLKVHLGHLFSICSIILAMMVLNGCATPQGKGPPTAPPQIEVPKVEVPKVEILRVTSRAFPDFVAVIAQEGDTLSSLAARHLNDPSMDWFIAEYNDISTLDPGQALIIPLRPYERGGLTTKGYQTVPVLSYHNFSLTSGNKMAVTKTSFEEQMKLLKEKGYHVITMDQLFDFLEFQGQIPKKSVVINIDDGWRSAYDIAMPILKKYGFPATLFIYTDLIVGSEKTLSWDLIQEIVNNGIDIQCHTKTHRNLTIMDQKESFRQYFEAIEKELSGCAEIVKKRVNRKIKYLAYPYGETNPLVIELAKKLGYKGALTVKRDSNPFFIHNFRINRSMIYGDFDLSQFEKHLTIFREELLK